MKRYANRSGNSGVLAYELRADAIRVKFRNGEVYVYTRASAGAQAVVAMSALAEAGQGLSTFISRYKPRHDPRQP